MIGAIIGDIIGSIYEWKNVKRKDFSLFTNISRYTDDSVMSIAIAKSILDCKGNYTHLSEVATANMQELGQDDPFAGYGMSFSKWLYSNNPTPYNSYGNGAAMRVSACGHAASSLEEAKKLSYAVTSVTHDHPEGIKGAESVATAIFLAKSGKSMEEIRRYVLDNYYDISFTLDEIRPTYTFQVSCQESVPQAFEALFEAKDFEDAIRNAISIGGDSDTIAAIAGSVAECYFGVPKALKEKALTYLKNRQRQIIEEFERIYGKYDI